MIGLVVARILPWPDLVLGATACAIAGQFGALVSVLTRVSGGGLDIDYRAGDRMLGIVGFARPVLGAILASAVYFATVGGVVPLEGPDEVVSRFAFFVAIGFIAGFSERYAQDMLSISPSDSQKAATSAAKLAWRDRPESTSSVVTCLASMAGLRYVTPVMSVPRRSVEVSWASAERTDQPSSIGSAVEPMAGIW